MGEARREMLELIVDDVARHGIADRSLREIAASIGSSHRMLIYHFGSRDGLVAAIVGEVESSQRELMTTSLSNGDPIDVVRANWDRVSAPELRPFVQLFFEAVATASRSGTGEFTTAWIDDARSLAETIDSPSDATDIRLAIAVIRGLLIDVITGTDAAVAKAALERFLAMWSTRT